MQAYLAIKNSSQLPAISVYCDDILLCSDVLSGSTTKFYICPVGSREITVLNNYGRVILNLLISLKSQKKYILDIATESSCTLFPL